MRLVAKNESEFQISVKQNSLNVKWFELEAIAKEWTVLIL